MSITILQGSRRVVAQADTGRWAPRRATRHASMRATAVAAPGQAGAPRGRRWGRPAMGARSQAEVMSGRLGREDLRAGNIITCAGSGDQGLWRLPGRGLGGLLLALAAVQSAPSPRGSPPARVLPRSASARSMAAKRCSNFRFARAASLPGRRRGGAPGSPSRTTDRPVRRRRRRGCRGKLGLDLGRLFTDLGEHGQGIVPVEPDFAGLSLQLERAREGGAPDGTRQAPRPLRRGWAPGISALAPAP